MTAISKYGSGPRTLVIHGGPGFTSDYLIEPLLKVSDRNTFVFYNQSYNEPTLDGCANELLHVIDEHFSNSTIRVVAHSWGCLVLLSALAKLSIEDEAAGKKLKAVLINPVPILKGLFDESIACFQQRIPQSEIEGAMRLAMSDPTGESAMAKLLPYYVANRQVCETLKIPLSFGAYQAVLGSMDEFNFSPAFVHLDEVSVMLGEEDITPRHMIQNILEHARAVEVIPQAGHFPLHEQPETALRVLANWLG